GEAIVAARPVRAAEALVARLSVAAILTFEAVIARGIFTGLGDCVVAFVRFHFLVARTARILVLEAGAVLAKDAEIMVRELEIIFGLDAVPRELRVARHALVFLEQLRGIAALPFILAIARLSAEILAPLPTTTAPAAALTIVDQMPTSLRSVS